MTRTAHSVNNVVITGLSQDDNVDDADLFGDLCQNNLSCKPLVLKRINFKN